MSKSNIFKEVMAEYSQKKLKNEATAERNLKIVYKKVPRIEEVHNELYKIGFKITKELLKKDVDGQVLINKLKEETEKLHKEEKDLLIKNGYPEDFLKPKYSCQLCKDTGYIDNEKCQCLKQSLITKYYDMSNVKTIIKKENFDTFDLRFYSTEKQEGGISPSDNIKGIYKTALEFCSKFPNKFSNFLLYGDVGLGKTFICNCISKEILDKGYTVLYVTAPDIFKTLEDYRFNRSSMNKPEFYISLLTTVDLLVIDDLGTEVSTVVTNSELFNIINSRHIAEKHTIISTNLSPKDLEDKYSHRIISRFVGNYEMIKFIGSDIRALKKYGID